MEKIYKSPIPSVELVSSHLWHFIYDEKYGSAVSKFVDKPAFIDGITDRRITFGEMRTLSTRLAYAFKHKLGLKPGDTVMILSNNRLLTPVMIHGLVAATLVYTGANFAYTEQEIAHQLGDSHAKAILTNPEFYDKAVRSAKLAGIPSNMIFNFQDDNGTPNSIWDLVDKNEYIPPQLTEEQAKSATALMCYSSGTSGKPKGVESTHYNLTSITLQAIASRKVDFPKQVYVCYTPFFHMYAAFYFNFRNFYPGATTVILPYFEMDLFLKTIERYRVTIVNTVPPVIVNLIKMQNVKEKYDFSSVVEVKSGAAPIGIDVISQFEDLFRRPMDIGYGMTESTCSISVGSIVTDKKDSVGPLLPNMEAKIVNGEILVRGPNIMKGYFGNAKANNDVFTSDGFMRTGDIGHFDEDSNLYITDRLKELIKYKGFQVAPAELEDLLLKHPDIADVAVIGILAEDKTNELPRAYVVLNEQSKGNAKPEDIIEWAAKQTAHFKRLRGGVYFRNSIPKSPSGKILRRLFRDEIEKELKPKL